MVVGVERVVASKVAGLSTGPSLAIEARVEFSQANTKLRFEG